MDKGTAIEMIQTGRVSELVTKISRYMRSMPGTASFSAARKQDITAMIETLGMPTAFITLSSAEQFWEAFNKNASERTGAEEAPAEETGEER